MKQIFCIQSLQNVALQGQLGTMRCIFTSARCRMPKKTKSVFHRSALVKSSVAHTRNNKIHATLCARVFFPHQLHTWRISQIITVCTTLHFLAVRFAGRVLEQPEQSRARFGRRDQRRRRGCGFGPETQ